MKAFLDRLHARLGDFWFFSLVLFLASRLADCLNVFVGIWLVPKYVSPDELGAVMPLTQFATLVAIPIAVFATVFMKEVNTLATQRAYGKMKSLMRGVFIAGGVILLLAIILSRLLLPAFLTRIRIVEGSLGFLILATGFLSCIAPIYTNALQALKRFKELSLLSLISAPLRLIAMLVTMPFRALSGYFIGQSAPSVLSIFGALFCLRKELAVPAEPYWTPSVYRRFGRLLAGTACFLIPYTLCGAIETTVLRQRLPDVESAAYYMVTRFSDIAGYLSIPLLATLFPFTAELAEQGKPTRSLVLKCCLAVVLSNAALALFFAIAGRPLLGLLPNGESYASYHWAIPWMIAVTTLNAIQGFHTNTEVSAGRFGFLWWWLPLNFGYPALLLLVTGYGYFTAWLPENVSAFLSAHNVTSLTAMMWWMTARTAISAGIALCGLMRTR